MSFRIIYVPIFIVSGVAAARVRQQIRRDYRCTAKVELARQRRPAKTPLFPLKGTKQSGVAQTETFKPVPAGSLSFFGSSQTAPEASEERSEQQEVESVSGWH